MNIILLAPPAAGKGTQSEKIVSKYNLKHISTGDLLRNCLKNNDELSNQIREIMNQGKLVDDEIIIKLIEKELTNSSLNGFVLDGFPRSLAQAKKFNELLNKLNKHLDLVLYLNIDKENALNRIIGRRTCPNCGRIYNILIENSKPLNENLCDECNVSLTKREDDNEVTFNKRYDTYVTETSPLIDFYKNQGLLVEFDSSLDADLVFENIIKELDLIK